MIEQELHFTTARSQVAANARAARMSSHSIDGKSARISSIDMPEARYSRMSATVIRRPRIHG